MTLSGHYNRTIYLIALQRTPHYDGTRRRFLLQTECGSTHIYRPRFGATEREVTVS